MNFTAAELAAYVSARVADDGGCLRWTGYLYNGHPGGTLNGKRFLVRRAVYQTERGPIAAGKVIRCTCSTPLCVSVEHMRATTYKAIALECGALGLMAGPVRIARIAATKRAGPQAKITQADARAIAGGDGPLAEDAARYGVAPSTVSRIRRGVSRREFGGNPFLGLLAKGGSMT